MALSLSVTQHTVLALVGNESKERIVLSLKPFFFFFKKFIFLFSTSKNYFFLSFSLLSYLTLARADTRWA